MIHGVRAIYFVLGISSMVADTAFYVCQVLVCYYDDALYHAETYLV